MDKHKDLQVLGLNEDTIEYIDFLYQDKSGDRKYFVIIPNMIIDSKLTMNELGVYLTIKRFAGENGEFVLPKREVEKRLKISRNTYTKIINRLCDKGFIYPGIPKMIDTQGGKQEIKTYCIVDVWAENNWEMAKRKKGVQKLNTLISKVVQKDTHKVVQKDTPIEEGTSIEERLEQSSKDDVPFSLKAELKKLDDSDRKDINIIGFILEEQHAEILNYGQFKNALDRNFRVAKKLKDYTNDQLLKACNTAKKEYPGIWTGETLLKILTK